MIYSECFYSIQGEGAMMGLPSVFFRTSHCNLRCWWCDTPYTSWKPENKKVSVEEAIDMISEYGCKNVVVTGGEPFLWKDELKLLCDSLWYQNYHVTIETNATMFEEVKVDLISMSPKLESSTPYEQDAKWAKKHNQDRIRMHVIQEFIDRCDPYQDGSDYQLKFVVTDGTDLEEIQDILADLRSYDPNKVYLMPEGRTEREIKEKEEEVIQLCMAHGFRYSDRIHTRVWNDKRGV